MGMESEWKDNEENGKKRRKSSGIPVKNIDV